MLYLMGLHRYSAVDGVVEADECLGAHHAGDVLDAVVEQLHEVLVVSGVEFEEHRVGAGGEVALDDLFDFLDLWDDASVHGSALKTYTYICAGGVPERFGVDCVARSGNDVHLGQALYALMDGRAADSAFNGYVLGRYTRIAHDDTQYFTVKIVYFFHLLDVYGISLPIGFVVPWDQVFRPRIFTFCQCRSIDFALRVTNNGKITKKA